MATELGNRIREFREKNRLSISELAKKAKVPRKSLLLYESGERKPLSHTVKDLANALNISSDMLYGKNNMPEFSVLKTVFKEVFYNILEDKYTLEFVDKDSNYFEINRDELEQLIVELQSILKRNYND